MFRDENGSYSGYSNHLKMSSNANNSHTPNAYYTNDGSKHTKPSVSLNKPSGG